MKECGKLKARFGLRSESVKIGRTTPVRMVAMDGGLSESRLIARCLELLDTGSGGSSVIGLDPLVRARWID
jgi:hypothetical protein